MKLLIMPYGNEISCCLGFLRGEIVENKIKKEKEKKKQY